MLKLFLKLFEGKGDKRPPNSVVFFAALNVHKSQRVLGARKR